MIQKSLPLMVRKRKFIFICGKRNCAYTEKKGVKICLFFGFKENVTCKKQFCFAIVSALKGVATKFNEDKDIFLKKLYMTSLPQRGCYLLDDEKKWCV